MLQTWSDINIEDTYWNGTGRHQDMYDKMEKAVEEGKWEWNKTTENVFFHYYRFFNDGDCPSSMKYRVVDYAKNLEAKADDRVLKEWKRFERIYGDREVRI